jgi:hypothetical protein
MDKAWALVNPGANLAPACGNSCALINSKKKCYCGWVIREPGAGFRGLALLWGRARINPDEARAAYIQPLALGLPFDEHWTCRLEKIAQTYNLPLLSLSKMKEISKTRQNISQLCRNVEIADKDTEPPPLPPPPKESPSAKPIEIPGIAVAMRAWSLTADDKLQSIGAGSENSNGWQPGVNKMHCLVNPEHLRPIADCQCGLHAWRNFDYYGWGQVTGVVQMWGHLEVHSDTIRAQYARPVLLAMPSYSQDLGVNPFNMIGTPPYQEEYERMTRRMTKIAAHYQCELAQGEEMQSRARAYGYQLPPLGPIPLPPKRPKPLSDRNLSWRLASKEMTIGDSIYE